MSRHPLLLLPLIVLVAIAQPAPESLGDAFAQGKVTLNARLRYEDARQTGFADSDALTLRTRLGFSTAPLHGFKLMLEAEDVTAADGDAYNQGGLNVPGAGAGKVVIADPEGTEVNQANLAFIHGTTTAVLGRQRVVLDNARFIGDVAWRQDQQTYDALTVALKPATDLTLTYGYLWQINRIFSDRLDWDSDSHVLNTSYGGLPLGTVTGYAYLLDFDNAAANSTATYGASLTGARPVSSNLKLLYRAEYAVQSDYGDSPLSYDAEYLALEAGLALKQVSLRAGYERLGSDNNVGFRTPLATLHAFNGWADVFLTTPGAGLEDTYVSVTATPTRGLTLAGFYHWFESDVGSIKYGEEIDLMATYAINAHFTALAKFASFNRDEGAIPDTERFTLELTFVY